ncbi:MAG: M81 family metallopeptidase [Caldilineaceae bacterium]|nr:M81 family metallopeptidase [Caldilineaceae bacterium]
MRIAIGGISNENSSFSPVRNHLAAFTIYTDAALLSSGRYPFLAAWPAVTWVPTLFAQALPGGPIDAETYQQLKAGILARLQAAGPLDGVYLDLHGAMFVDDLQDAEAELASAVRQVVGPHAIIAASMDLHGNISAPFTAQIDLITAYRTAPHRDTLETRQRACELLVQAITTGVRPQIALTPIPVLLAGEHTRTDVEPGTSLWATLPAIDQVPGVLHAALFVGFAWVDEARAHAAAVISGTDRAVIQREANQLARAYWQARHQFGFGTPSGSIDECITTALAAPEPCVFLSDSGDNVTAGAVGDLPLFLERLLAHAVPSALVAGLLDAEAVATCQRAGVGATVDTTLGGKLDTRHGKPLPVRGRVLRLIDDASRGRQAVLQVDGVTVILTAQRLGFTTIEHFTSVGIDPLHYRLVVVKLGYLFPDLIRIAPKALLALSPGASDLALERLPYHQIQRPMYPVDKEFAWTPTP